MLEIDAKSTLDTLNRIVQLEKFVAMRFAFTFAFHSFQENHPYVEGAVSNRFFFHEPRKTYALRIVDLDETLHANRNEKLNRVLQNKTLMLYYVHVCNCNGHEFRC